MGQALEALANRFNRGGMFMSDELPPKPAPSERDEKRLREEYGLDAQPSNGSALAYSGLEFGGIVCASIVIGLLLDRQFGTKPWIMLALIAFGMVGGMYRLIHRVMRGAEK